MTRKTTLNYLLLLGIGLTWGSQFLFNSIAIQSLPPYAIATGRTLVAGLCLLLLTCCIKEKKDTALAQATKEKNRKSLTAVKIFAIALLEAVFPFHLIADGQQYIDSSITAILLGTIPIFTAVLVKLFISQEKISLGLLLSIFLGFLGLLILLWPSLLEANPRHLIAEAKVLAGAFSFSCALIVIKTLPQISPVRLTRNIFLVGAIPLILNILVFHPDVYKQINLSSLLSILALGIICSACAYMMFVKLISLAGATFASLSNYLVPVFGAMLGVIILDEHVTFNMIAALIIISSALVIAKIPFLNRRVMS